MASTAQEGVQTKRKRTKGGRYSHDIKKEEIEQYYHLPCEEASRQLGIGLTILKRICRRLGIEKWPYRQLKRQGKLGDGLLAAHLAGGDTASGGGQGGSEPPLWYPDGTTQQPGSSTSSGGSGGSWRAQHRDQTASAAPPAGAPEWLHLPVGQLSGLRRQVSEPLAPLPPQLGQQPQAPPRRQRSSSQDLGSVPHLPRHSGGNGRADSPGRSGGSSSAGGAAAAASCFGAPGLQLQRVPSAALKRIRENDSMLSLGAAEELSPASNPFEAAAALAPDASWETRDDGGGSGGAASSGFEGGAEQLTLGLSRLAMRTLSLPKRQCSRDGGALDALDHALLMEQVQRTQRLVPTGCAPGAMARACSMPAARAQRDTPPQQRKQQRLPPLPPYMQHPAAAAVHASAFEPGTASPFATLQSPGAFAAEELDLAAAAAATQQLQVQAGVAQQLAAPQRLGAALPSPLTRLEADNPFLGDASLSSLFAMPPLKHHSGGSEALSEGCLLPEQSGARDDSLLLDWEHGERGLLPRISSSGNVRLLARGNLQAAAAAAAAPLSFLELDASGVHAWQQRQLAAAAAAGAAPSGAGTPAAAGELLPLADGGDGDLLISPFSMASGAMEDHEVDDLLADFLSTSPTDMQQASQLRMAEMLACPFPGSEDATFAGLESPCHTPGMAALQAVMAAHAQQLPPAAAGAVGHHAPGAVDAVQAAAAAAAAATAAAGMAAGVKQEPLVSQPPQQQQPVSAGSQHSQRGDGAGSGSVVSHGTPTSSGSNAMHVPAGIAMPLGASVDVVQLAAKLVNDSDPVKQLLANQLLQKQQELLHHQHQLQQQQMLQLHQHQLQQRQQQQGAGDQQGLSRLQQLRQQLAAAQAQQVELQRRQQQQQLPAGQQAEVQRYASQRAFMSEVTSAFSGGAAPRLRAPPPLPAHAGRPSGALPLSSTPPPLPQQEAVAAGPTPELASWRAATLGQHQQRNVHFRDLPQLPPQQQAQPALAQQQATQQHAAAQQAQEQAALADLYSQWSAEHMSGESPTLAPNWPVLQPAWIARQQQQSPQQQREQQQPMQQQPRMMAQRAASAPLPWDLDWEAML